MNDGSGLRVPPHSAEAERGVLGSVLLDPLECLGKTQTAGLVDVSFYDRRHQELYLQMVEMASAGVPMDALTIGEWLKGHDALEKVGGYDYLIELQDAQLVTAHVQHYSEIVLEKRRLRDLIMLGSNVVDRVYKGELSASELEQMASSELVSLMNRKQDVSNKALLDAWYERMEGIKRGEIQNGLPLPWPGLDDMMCGLQPGLIVVGARPSAGKTTMAVNLSDYLVREGCHGASACLDMSREQLLVRSVIRESRVSLPRLNRGYARWSQIETVKECKNLVAKWPLHVIEERTLQGVCSQARMLKLKFDIQFLVIDFLTQLHVEGWRGDRRTEIGRITSTLKALAFDLGIPVILLSQLSRGSVKDARAPRLDDLRESGDIEQDATQVLLIYKALPEYYEAYDKDNNPEPLPEDADRRFLRGVIFDLAKNQQGETGMVEMWMRPNYFRFEEAEPGFVDLQGKLAEFGMETAKDDACDPSEDAVTDTDDVEV